jgi:hypothetical protein
MTSLSRAGHLIDYSLAASAPTASHGQLCAVTTELCILTQKMCETASVQSKSIARITAQAWTPGHPARSPAATTITKSP